MKVYGIKSCDTCRKARKWLDEQDRTHDWHDLREDGIDIETIRRWLDATGPEMLVNRRSTTWRGLDENRRALAMNSETAPNLLVKHPTLIKRPVIETGDGIMVGFNAAVRDAL